MEQSIKWKWKWEKWIIVCNAFCCRNFAHNSKFWKSKAEMEVSAFAMGRDIDYQLHSLVCMTLYKL